MFRILKVWIACTIVVHLLLEADATISYNLKEVAMNAQGYLLSDLLASLLNQRSQYECNKANNHI